jgi:RIP metalloprotease RseP
MNWYILAIIPVLGSLVFVHELGHFLAAKWAGIHVEEFGIGFPPALVSVRRRERGGWEVLWFGQGREHNDTATQNPFTGTSGGTNRPAYKATLYSLNLLPIGGFVRMPGETGDAVDESGRYDPESFAAKSAGKRIIVLCAGVFMNLLLAFALFTVAYSVGEPKLASVIGTVESNSPAATAGLLANDRIISINDTSVKSFDEISGGIKAAISADKSNSPTVRVKLVIQHSGSSAQKTLYVDAPVKGQGAIGISEPDTVVGTVEPKSPAATAGLQTNDRIVSVNNTSVKTVDDVIKKVGSAIGNDKSNRSTVRVELVVQHSGSSAQKTLYVDARKHPPKGKGAMGIAFVNGPVTLVTTPFWQAPFKGIVQTYDWLHTILSQIKEMIVSPIKPEVAGPVGIAQITGDYAQLTPTFGWWPILSLTAILSLNLAIMNILPFPALDGGRVVLVLVELLRGGKRLKPEREGIINFIGIAILLLLMVVVTVNDVIRWVS